MSNNIELVGLDRFTATSAAAARRLDDLSEPHAQAIDLLETEAKAKAPRRTGHLLASFGARITETTAELINSAPYARFQNFGTRYISARRFMPTPEPSQLVPLYVDYIDDVIDTIQGK